MMIGVTVDEVMLKDSKDHIIINANQNKIVRFSSASHQVKMFMLYGKFDHNQYKLGKECYLLKR